jgi:predicted membrane-bound mannosyltransferase
LAKKLAKNSTHCITLLRRDKWLCAVAAFALVYAAVLAFAFGGSALHWDEINHLNGALLLTRGQIWDYAAINSFYPPLYNLVMTAYFFVVGASVFTARLVTLTFTVLSILLVYLTAKDMYSSQVGLVAAVLFAVMPGIVWLSGLAMVETMLIFMVTFSLACFFRWLQTGSRPFLAASMVALVLGVVTKYQSLVVVPLVMIVGLLALSKGDVMKREIYRICSSKRLWLIIPIAVAAAVFLYAFYVSGLLDVWLYAIQIGNMGQTEYSLRFPTPVFYIVEMVWPYANSHPVSLLVYLLGLTGLAFFAIRRKPQDKYLLVWFLVTYVVFTLIPNRQWRYVSLVFPVLAVAAAELAVSAYSKAQKTWQSGFTGTTKKRLAKVSAIFLITLTFSGVAYSIVDAYTWVKDDHISVPAEEAAAYIATKAPLDGSVLVLCPFNRFNKDMVWFCLNNKSANITEVYQYPELAVDAYPPDFSITFLVSYCQTNGTQYVLLYEYESTPTYYGSPLNEQSIYSLLNSTGRFNLEATFGVAPRRMYVFLFDSKANAD